MWYCKVRQKSTGMASGTRRPCGHRRNESLSFRRQLAGQYGFRLRVARAAAVHRGGIASRTPTVTTLRPGITTAVGTRPSSARASSSAGACTWSVHLGAGIVYGGGTVLGGSALAYATSTTTAIAGASAAAMQVYAGDPNAGFASLRAFGIGLGGGFGGVMPTAGLWDLGELWLAVASKRRSSAVRSSARRCNGAACSAASLATGFSQGWTTAAWQSSFAAGGAGVGYAWTGNGKACSAQPRHGHRRDRRRDCGRRREDVSWGGLKGCGCICIDGSVAIWSDAYGCTIPEGEQVLRRYGVAIPCEVTAPRHHVGNRLF